MNKIKFLAPIFGLGAVTAAAIPLTACGSEAPASTGLSKETYDAGDKKPYSDIYTAGETVAIRDAMPIYVKHFKKHLNSTLAKEIAYCEAAKLGTQASWSIAIRECKFNASSHRLSCKVNITAVTDVYNFEIHNVKYGTEPQFSENLTSVNFLPLGSDGEILEDKNWFIKYKLPGSEAVVMNSSATIAEWNEFWDDNGDFISFEPAFYSETSPV